MINKFIAYLGVTYITDLTVCYYVFPEKFYSPRGNFVLQVITELGSLEGFQVVMEARAFILDVSIINYNNPQEENFVSTK